MDVVDEGCRICPVLQRPTTKVSTLTPRDVANSQSDFWTVAWPRFL
ncbi:MAG: hypothetical protein MJE68_26050 [Proteobacteria bacterium]|nr:hypothetical protein [Pseudomonadota bacterium]